MSINCVDQTDNKSITSFLRLLDLTSSRKYRSQQIRIVSMVYIKIHDRSFLGEIKLRIHTKCASIINVCSIRKWLESQTNIEIDVAS
uniref:SJCHGC09801 protein n=1 Tax=Schistosoma japonicum TaxID=6182 RepID=Q5BQU8_SCHJA|nr:SJCHGC09801 protein [Schistosoma japonicum]